MIETVASAGLSSLVTEFGTEAPPPFDADVPKRAPQPGPRDLHAVFGDRESDRAQWAVSFYSLRNAEQLYDLNARRLMVPASIQKMLTSAVAAGFPVNTSGRATSYSGLHYQYQSQPRITRTSLLGCTTSCSTLSSTSPRRPTSSTVVRYR